MKRKIFEGKCKKKKITIFLNEEIWQNLCAKFGLSDKPEVIAKKWWQGNDWLNYFLLRFLKIKTKKLFTLGEYYYKQHQIVLYPEITILFVDITTNEDLKKIFQEREDLKFLLASHLAHEFGHALDRLRIIEIYSKIKKIKPRVKQMEFFIKAKRIFEKRARQFEDEYGLLFIDAIEVVN